MANEKILSAIKTASKEAGVELSLAQSTWDSTLKALNVDSLNAMSIIINVERALNVRLPDEDLANLKTIGDLINSFEKLVK